MRGTLHLRASSNMPCVAGSKALYLRGRLPVVEVLQLIEHFIRPHDLNRLKIDASVHYKFVLRQFNNALHAMTISCKPWSPYPTLWDWSDPLCIECYRTSILEAAKLKLY